MKDLGSLGRPRAEIDLPCGVAMAAGYNSTGSMLIEFALINAATASFCGLAEQERRAERWLLVLRGLRANMDL